MNRIFQHRYLLRRSLIPMIGICLFLYFSYHIVQGERSVIRLAALQKNLTEMSLEYDSVSQERHFLEQKVVMLRPGSVNPDFLEERARIVLGYTRPGEVAILTN